MKSTRANEPATNEDLIDSITSFAAAVARRILSVSENGLMDYAPARGFKRIPNGQLPEGPVYIGIELPDYFKEMEPSHAEKFIQKLFRGYNELLESIDEYKPTSRFSVTLHNETFYINIQPIIELHGKGITLKDFSSNKGLSRRDAIKGMIGGLLGIDGVRRMAGNDKITGEVETVAGMYLGKKAIRRGISNVAENIVASCVDQERAESHWQHFVERVCEQVNSATK